MIVLTLGLSSGRLEVAALGAGAAVLVVGVVGTLVARQLSEVPENALKLGVGLMLVTFGTFWAGEGVGVGWPGADLFLLGLLALYGMAAWVLVRFLGREQLRPEVAA